MERLLLWLLGVLKGAAIAGIGVMLWHHNVGGAIICLVVFGIGVIATLVLVEGL